MLWATNLHKSYGARTVLCGVSLTVAPRDRVGIVGANGAGKTTLLRLLAGEPADAGGVRMTPGIRIGLLPQGLPDLEGTVWDAMLAGASSILELRARWAAIADALERTPADPHLLDQYGAVQAQLEHTGGYELEIRAEEILRGLGLPRALWTQPVGVLSGGERTRLSLARTLLPAPDLLLLDEPTNHLDLWAIEWLEQFIAGFGGAVVVASHDRQLLNAAASRIVELDDGLAREYAGNFSVYRAAKAAALAAQHEAYGTAEETRRVLDVALDLGLLMHDARAVLAAMLFRGDRVFQPVSTLSGGERTRLDLLELVGTKTNVLPLDEPTNHLDLPSRERLEDALEAYDGTLVVASHDRYLLERLCTTIWAIDGGTVRSVRVRRIPPAATELFTPGGV